MTQITDSDREAAADIWRDYVARVGEVMVEKQMRQGGLDDGLPTRLAEHRTQSTTAMSAEIERSEKHRNDLADRNTSLSIENGALKATIAQLRDRVDAETGWLIELPLTARCGGRLCWVALEPGAFPKYKTLNHNEDYDFQQAESPLKFTPDHNEALRFARKQDAEAFMQKFDRFLLHAVATEHHWADYPTEARALLTQNEVG